MSNNLSRQLCELSGIEPKYYFYDLRHKEFVEINHKTYSKFKNEYQTKETYPDFTKPENFVRLFNLPIVNNGARTVGYFVVYEFTMKTVEEFIECLIIKLERTQLLVTGEVKQSIREAEWVYD